MPERTIAPEEVRAQLARVLAADPLVHAPSLARFLAFAVDRALAGDTAALKESIVGEQVFQRGPDFDPKVDPIVRIQAGNLRNRLARYYEGAGAADPIRIEIPKGTYVPVFHSQLCEPAAAEPSNVRKRWIVAGLLTSLLLGCAAWALRRAAPAVEVRSLAVLPFLDLSPSKDQEYFCDGLVDELTGNRGARCVLLPQF